MGDGQVALVTGAAGGGTGRAICRRLAADGASVAVTDVHERRTEETVAELRSEFPGSDIEGFVLDVGDCASIDRAIEETTRTLGPISVLVNNAAVNVLGDFFEYEYDDWERCLTADLSGPFWLSRQAMRQMRARGGGVIVNISSIAAELAPPDEVAYAVAKAGLHALTRCCARAGGPHGIRVAAVVTGVILGTRFAERHQEMIATAAPPPLGHHPSADDVADVVAFLASDHARHITGEILNVSAGAHMRP